MQEAEQAWHQCWSARAQPVPASGPKDTAPSPTQSPDLLFPQVSIQLQGLLQGLATTCFLLPGRPAPQHRARSPAAQPFPGSGGKEGTMKQLLGSSENEAGPALKAHHHPSHLSSSPTSPHLWCPD